MERIERRWQRRTDSTRDQSPETFEPVTVSEQLVVMSDPVSLWRLVWDPATSALVLDQVVSAFAVPGTPAGQVGEMQMQMSPALGRHLSVEQYRSCPHVAQRAGSHVRQPRGLGFDLPVAGGTDCPATPRPYANHQQRSSSADRPPAAHRRQHPRAVPVFRRVPGAAYPTRFRRCNCPGWSAPGLDRAQLAAV